MNYWGWGRGEGAKAGLQSSSTYPLPTVVCTSMQVVVSNQMLGEGAHEWLQGWVLTNNAHLQNQVSPKCKGSGEQWAGGQGGSLQGKGGEWERATAAKGVKVACGGGRRPIGSLAACLDFEAYGLWW